MLAFTDGVTDFGYKKHFLFFSCGKETVTVKTKLHLKARGKIEALQHKRLKCLFMMLSNSCISAQKYRHCGKSSRLAGWMSCTGLCRRKMDF